MLTSLIFFLCVTKNTPILSFADVIVFLDSLECQEPCIIAWQAWLSLKDLFITGGIDYVKVVACW